MKISSKIVIESSFINVQLGRDYHLEISMERRNEHVLAVGRRTDTAAGLKCNTS
jgi:hypothetical protein